MTNKENFTLIREALEYQEDHSGEGPLFPEALDELDKLMRSVEQLEVSQGELLEEVQSLQAHRDRWRQRYLDAVAGLETPDNNTTTSPATEPKP